MPSATLTNSATDPSVYHGKGLPEEERALFRDAVGDVRPLAAPERVTPRAARPHPLPKYTGDERPIQTGNIPWDTLLEEGEERTFLRPGIARKVLKELRRGHWTIEGETDLHGLTSDEAYALLDDFLHTCRQRGLRCVRVIHGKGLHSPNREAVLKPLAAGWLMQREEVQAFCPAKPADGGSGALVVLLRGAP